MPLVTASGHIGTKGRQTHVAILDAAEAIFAEKGFSRTRLEDIAERVGVRRASLVYYYKTKAALYGAVLDRLLGGLLAQYDFTPRSERPADRLGRIVEAWAEYIEARPALLRIMLREMADGFTPHARPFASRVAPFIGAIGSTIPEAHASTTVDPINPLHFMMVIVGASAFLLLGGPLASPAARGDRRPPGESQHRLLLRSLARALLARIPADSERSPTTYARRPKAGGAR